PGAAEGPAGVDSGSLEGDTTDSFWAQDFYRLQPEPDDQPARVARGRRVRGRVLRPPRDRDQVAAYPPVGLGQRGALAGGVERGQVGFVGVHDDLNARQFPQLTQLLGG